jgi:hypothetical protein
MNYAVERLIELAEAEVGYLEKKSNSQLDDKTANAGYGNYTKYARDLYKAGYYGFTNPYAWCDAFVDWLMYNLCDKDMKKAIHVTCQSGDGTALCSSSMAGFKRAGRFYKSPQPGDQIFFYESDLVGIAHTGMVYKVDSSRVYTIEGNTSGYSGVVANGGCVAKKSYSLSYNRIAGYGRPRFEEIAIIPENFFSIYLSESTSTTAKINVTFTEDTKEISCDWILELVNLKNNNILESKKSKQIKDSLTFAKLTPNTLYSVKLMAVTSSYIQEQQIFFATPQELPGTISKLLVSFSEGSELNKNCKVEFTMPNSAWGAYSKNNRSKGYRTYLILNGAAVAYSDSLITYTNADKIISNFNFSDIANIKVDYHSMVQIGIQTWVKDEYGNILLNDEGPICSKSLYLKHSLNVIDKIYVKTNDSFNRALIYMPHFKNN